MPDRAVTEVIEEEGAPPPPPPRGGPPWDDLAPWLLLLLVLVLGGVAAAYFLTRDNHHHRATPATTVVTTVATATTPTAARATTAAPKPAGIAVPYVVGKQAPAAVKRLTRDGLRPQVKSVFAAKPTGIVVSEKPTAGTRLKKGSLVTLNVSKGKRLAPVPDVVGQTSKQALALLRAAGLGGRVFEVPNVQPVGTVVAQNPKGGRLAGPSVIVRLNVSSGAPQTTAPAATAPAATTAPATTAPATTAPAATAPAPPAPSTTTARTPPAPTPVTVPNVVGEPLAQARATIRQSGLVTETRQVPSSQAQGTVVAQSPKAGTSAKRGDHVLINISQGPKQAAPAQATVPNVVGQDQAAATSQLRSAGFAVSVQQQPTTDPSQNGVVVDQQPAAGSAAPKGSQVTLDVGSTSG
jgi:serine/threonine-protein kinase